MSSIAVVTANIGRHDNLHPFAQQTVPAEYLYFTDDLLMRRAEAAPPPPWAVVTVPDLDGDPRLLAKRYRMPPFPEGLDAFDYVVWVDASTEVTNECFLEEAVDFVARSTAPLATWSHPVRDCIYAECRMSLVESSGKYEPWRETMEKQVLEYAEQEYPRHNGLYATGTLVWDMNDPRAGQLGAAWLEEIERTSIQDQLSLPFVAWRLGIPIATFPFSQLELPVHTGLVGNRWLNYHDHRRLR